MKSKYYVVASLLLFATGCTPRPYTSQDGSVKTTYLHQYGMELADNEEWKERGSSGQIIKQYKDGTHVKESWHDGKLHGIATTTFPHSNTIHKETYYDNGARVWQQANYSSGMPKRQEVFRPGNIVMVSSWFEDGTPRSAEEYHGENLWSGQYFTKEQELDTQVMQGNGERMKRDGHGQLLAKDEIENGKKIVEIEYYPNGMPQKYIPYINDRIEGTLKTFYAGGEPATIEQWKNNSQHGDCVVFRSGERIAVVPYVAGQKEGVEMRFRPGTEEVTEEITWQNSLKHGPCILFIDQDKVTDYYYEGEKVSRIEFAQRDAGSRMRSAP